MEKTQITNAIESLKKFSVETTVLNSTLSNLWYNLSTDASTLLTKFKQYENSGRDVSELQAEANQLHDVIQRAQRSIVKLTNKSDLVEVITKRAKIMEEFLSIEQKLESLRSTDQKKHYQLSTVFNFTTYMDILDSIDLLLHLRQSVVMSSDISKHDHLTTLTSLIDFLNGQRPNNPIQTPVWPLETMNKNALQTLKHTFHGRIQQSSDDEGNHDSELCVGYGTSHRGIWQGLPVMIKKVQPQAFHREAIGLKEALSILEVNSRYIQESPFLTQVIGVGWEANRSDIYLISPLAPHLSLFDAFSNPALDPKYKLPLNPAQKASILCDVSAGIAHLHRHGVVHGRLKDSNILLFDGYRAKLSDYGVETFLSNDTRARCKGCHGIRWCPPEIARYEHFVEQSNDNRTADVHQLTIECLSAIYPYPVAASTDTYAIGVLAIVLMTECQPFSNVPWDEGVKSQLLQGHIPLLPTQYKEKSTMAILADTVVNSCCTLDIGRRPMADQLLQKVEEGFVKIVRVEDDKECKEYSDNIISVQQEIEEITKKIAEHEILIQRGDDLIAKKDLEKRKATDAMVRREKEVELERARVRLQGFREELMGLQEDKDGAESDL